MRPRARVIHLHTHVIVPNRQARADGRLVSLDGTSLFHEARGQDDLSGDVARGVECVAGVGGRIDPDTGMAEVAGVDRRTIVAWSQRASQLREWARGNLVLADEQPSAAQLGVAQKATRPRKPEVCRGRRCAPIGPPMRAGSPSMSRRSGRPAR